MMSDGLKEKAKQLGFWSGEGPFHFANCFSDGSTDDCPRFANGSGLLRKLTSGNAFDAKKMIQILRNEESGIAMRDGMFQSTSSQVNSTKTILNFVLRLCDDHNYSSPSGVCFESCWKQAPQSSLVHRHSRPRSVRFQAFHLHKQSPNWHFARLS